MPGQLVRVAELYGKDIFAKTATNIRSLPSVEVGKILRVVKKGDRIGTVESHVNGFTTSYSQKDGSIWLQLQKVRGENEGKPSYVKLFPDMLDWKTLKEQGAQTVEEEEKEKAEKDKKLEDKLLNAGKWLLIGWVAVEALKTSGTKNKRNGKR